MKQVNKDHYNFMKYSNPARWISYYHQANEIISTKPQSVLEIGVGDSVVSSYFKRNTDILYKTMDIDKELEPDVIGSVLDIPFENDSFDTVCIFEVLEHLPFSDFERALKELKRVSRDNVIISLPHFGPPVQFFVKIPFIRLKLFFKIPFYKEHKFNGEHYWELGKKGYSVKKILTILNKYFNIQKHFVPFESQYHHFFVIRNHTYEK